MGDAVISSYGPQQMSDAIANQIGIYGMVTIVPWGKSRGVCYLQHDGKFAQKLAQCIFGRYKNKVPAVRA